MNHYVVRVCDGNTFDSYGPWRNKKEALKGRTAIIKSLGGYLKSAGWEREQWTVDMDKDTLLFKHAVWATVVITLVEDS